jgi:L-amino acid N-acyltransferase YncA
VKPPLAGRVAARGGVQTAPMIETWTADDATRVTIRPIRAADLALELEFVSALSADTRYLRLMTTRRPSLEELRRFTDIDYEREWALIATTRQQGRERQIGVARYVRLSTPGVAEAAIVVSDAWQGRGLGTRLLTGLIAAASRRGVRRLVGMTLAANSRMLALGHRLGFTSSRDAHSATVVHLTLELETDSPLASSAAPRDGPPEARGLHGR